MEAQWEGNLDTFGGFALSFDGLESFKLPYFKQKTGSGGGRALPAAVAG